MTASHSARADDRGIVTLRSPYSFAETVERLRTALDAHGIKIFCAIDQRAEAGAVGLEMPATMLLLFGNPKAGTPIMLARPLSALDLPLKALVSESSSGEVRVSFNATRYLIERHLLPSELSSNLAAAEGLIAGALSA